MPSLLADKVAVVPKPLPEDTWRQARHAVTAQTGIQTGMVMPSLLADKVTVVTDMDTGRHGDAALLADKVTVVPKPRPEDTWRQACGHVTDTDTGRHHDAITAGRQSHGRHRQGYRQAW